MTKICTECKREIEEGAAFCTECGAKAPAENSTVTASDAVPEIKAEARYETPAPAPSPAVTATPAPQQTYPQSAPDPTAKVVGTGAFFGLMLLFAIPIIGFIACIIMAFAPKNKNVKHFARAMLIWAAIALVLSIILTVVLFVMAGSMMSYLGQLIDGGITDIGDLYGQLDGIEDIISEYQNGGLESLPVD